MFERKSGDDEAGDSRKEDQRGGSWREEDDVAPPTGRSRKKTEKDFHKSTGSDCRAETFTLKAPFRLSGSGTSRAP